MRDPAENKDLLPATAFFSRPDVDHEKAWYEALGLIKQERDRMRLLRTTCDVTDYSESRETFGCCLGTASCLGAVRGCPPWRVPCLSREAFTNALTRDLGANVEFGDVEYTPVGIADSAANDIIDDRLFKTATREQAVLDYLSKERRDLFFLKSDDWATEYEFRVLLTSTDDEYAFADYGESLQAVVLGEQFPDW